MSLYPLFDLLKKPPHASMFSLILITLIKLSCSHNIQKSRMKHGFIFLIHLFIDLFWSMTHELIDSLYAYCLNPLCRARSYIEKLGEFTFLFD